MVKRIIKVGLLLGMVLVVSACSGGTDLHKDLNATATPMNVIYAKVYNGTVDGWSTADWLVPLMWAIAAAAVLGVGVGFLLKESDNNTAIAAGLTVGIVAFGITYVAVRNTYVTSLPDKAETQGIHAMTLGVDKAKHDKANVYVEVLDTPVTKVDVEYRDCDRGYDGDSKCYPYQYWERAPDTEYCAEYDKHDHCTDWVTVHHYYEYPYFKHQERYLAYFHLMDKLVTPETGLEPTDGVTDTPHRYFSGWMAPEDWQHDWASGERTTPKPADYTPPADWARYRTMLQSNHVPLANVWHRYVNWIFTADHDAYATYQGDIAAYQKAGLLPTMNTIYSRIGVGWAADYDCVQFLGLQVPADVALQFQQDCDAYMSYFSNDRQGTLVIAFAPASKVDNIDKWSLAIKANYTVRGQWDVNVNGTVLHRLLPKNLFIIACTVDDKNMVNACRLQTAMPRGNEKIAGTFTAGRAAELQNVAFTPVGFFGNIWAEPAPDKSGSPVTLHLEPGKPMDLPLRADPEGIRRVSMKDYDYLQSDIFLNTDDVNNLVAAEVSVQTDAASHDLLIAGIGLFIALCLGGFAVASASNS